MAVKLCPWATICKIAETFVDGFWRNDWEISDQVHYGLQSTHFVTILKLAPYQCSGYQFTMVVSLFPWATARKMTGCLFVWLAGWLTGWLAWLAGLAGLAGSLAVWLASEVLSQPASCLAGYTFLNFFYFLSIS